MKQWYAKELSQLANVSVRTLHYYDKIGLVQPSLRQSNNYRLYSEKDLLKLQQVLALKFFGFELAQIKQLLVRHEDVFENLTLQAKCLQEKANTLLEAHAILKRITDDCSDKQSIPWENIIQLIGVYHMSQQIEDAWVKDIFTPSELKQYVAFENDLKSGATPEQKAAFEKKWFNLVEALKRHLEQDPASDAGIHLADQFMSWVNGVYGKKYAHLRTKKFEQGFGEGKGLEQSGLTSEIMTWLEKALDAYWERRLLMVLDNVGQVPSSQVLQQWHEVMDDMYGDEGERKQAVAVMALEHDKTSPEAKTWLKTVFKL